MIEVGRAATVLEQIVLSIELGEAEVPCPRTQKQGVSDTTFARK